MRSNGWMAAAGAVLALAVVIVLGAGMAHSKPGGGRCHGYGPRARLDRLEAKLADLELDAETRAAAAQVIAEARTGSEARRDGLRAARQTLRELLDQKSPAVEAVMAQADAIGALETESRKAQLRTMLELRERLGAEQWQALEASLHRGRGERMGKP